MYFPFLLKTYQRSLCGVTIGISRFFVAFSDIIAYHVNSTVARVDCIAACNKPEIG
jgi:hypothetical protein